MKKGICVHFEMLLCTCCGVKMEYLTFKYQMDCFCGYNVDDFWLKYGKLNFMD